ncbi:MAG: CoA transferase [Actinomycetota bacterium]|nr:CoA transferase [Actinomycetota bacterium]
MTDQLLEGLRVLDLSLWQPGHYATQLMADLGAEVTKIEPPGGERERAVLDRHINFNGRKASVVLNLKKDEDRARLMELVASAEVVLEGYRPGVAARLGVSFEQLQAVNPAIVLCSISGFGQSGPLAAETGHEQNYQAYAGAMTVRTGQSPIAPGVLVGDQGSGMAAAFAILAAVLCARRTGVGEHIDVSMTDLMASWVAPLGAVDARRPGLQAHDGQGGSPGMGTFRTADDQWIVLGIYSEDHFWDALCRELGLDDHIGLTMAERSAQSQTLAANIAETIAQHNCLELLDQLRRASVPIAPVLTRQQMLEHPHFRERGTLTIGPDGYLTLGHPIRYRVHPALAPGSPPELGENPFS